MQINLPTLMIAASFVAAVSGMFLIFAWLQDREARAPLWWAAANLVLAIGVPLLTAPGSAFGVPSTTIGLALLDLSPALIWAAALSCNGRSPRLGLIVAGAVVTLCVLPLQINLGPAAEMTLCLGIAAAYLFAAALEFWFGREERIQARWPLIVLLILHGTFFATGAVLAALGSLATGEQPTIDSWFGLIHFETLAFVIGTAIFAVAMVKERRELEQMTAARMDALTGVANRRAFLETAGRLLARHLADDAPLSLIVFDLDRFKDINDNFGHAVGDRVLETFAMTARGALRAGDVVGRPGGEEFAAVLPGSSAGAAYVAAERIRESFSTACLAFGLAGRAATVSAGVASAHTDSTLDSLFAAADRALYEAKAAGRDRVAIAERDRQQKQKTREAAGATREAA